MGELKTTVNDASVNDFINSIEDENKRKETFVLLEMYEKITGEAAKMWGPSIIGFSKYSYKSDSSNKENEMPLAAFSPRKQNFTLYVMPSWGNLDELLAKLGKYSTSKACLYIKKLSDVDMQVLEEIIKVSFEESKKRLL
jgi:hypothetical protein